MTFPRTTTRGGHRLATAFLVLACCPFPSLAASAPPSSSPAREVSRLQILMIDGGGSKDKNYQSHLLHLRALHDILLRAGVPPGVISLHVSDGADPAPDLAMREAQPEPDFWLLEGSALEGPLRTPVTYENSSVPGAVLSPATRGDIQHWFDTSGRTLRAGDTLLLYVTDHGSRGGQAGENAITLWGSGERLPVSDLATMLKTLDPGVRVVMLMSQCYSGGFAELATARSTGDLPDGSTCGYFSSTADRPAYGCYPENRGRDNVGHSFHFIEALAERGDFPWAHDEVLVRDASPDVPLRTSDTYLERILAHAAETEGIEQTQFIDTLLRQAWTTPEAHETDLRLLDRIGHAYGIPGPRLLRELDDQTTRIPDLASQLRTQSTAWQAALQSASRANVERFIDAHPGWKPRLDEQALRALPPDGARTLTTGLLAELGPATRADAGVSRRLALLRDRAEESGSVAYRMDVRAGVLLRLRARLITVAGQEYLARRGSSAERSAYEALRRCEDLEIPPVPLPEELQLARSEPFPPLADDLVVATRVTPAWMGIQFRQPSETVRATAHVAPGAASVVAVYDHSPAKTAGLRPGDLVLGPPGRHFAERDQIREWTMLSPVDQVAALDVVRDGGSVAVKLTPKPFPQKWPELPGPPKVGSAAPPLRLGSYRGTPPRSLASGTPHLLFFWATWCAICKSSLPEIEAFERERHTPVIAITDEDRTRLDPFFAGHTGPFPALVATDENRLAFMAYGVSGMPTFVLVDGKGVVRGYATGYSPAKGLALDGWQWADRPAPSPG